MKLKVERRFRERQCGPRKGVLVLIGIPKPVLGESCTTFIKDIAIFFLLEKKIMAINTKMCQSLFKKTEFIVINMKNRQNEKIHAVVYYSLYLSTKTEVQKLYFLSLSDRERANRSNVLKRGNHIRRFKNRFFFNCINY